MYYFNRLLYDSLRFLNTNTRSVYYTNTNQYIKMGYFKTFFEWEDGVCRSFIFLRQATFSLNVTLSSNRLRSSQLLFCWKFECNPSEEIYLRMFQMLVDDGFRILKTPFKKEKISNSYNKVLEWFHFPMKDRCLGYWASNFLNIYYTLEKSGISTKVIRRVSFKNSEATSNASERSVKNVRHSSARRS